MTLSFGDFELDQERRQLLRAGPACLSRAQGLRASEPARRAPPARAVPRSDPRRGLARDLRLRIDPGCGRERHPPGPGRRRAAAALRPDSARLRLRVLRGGARHGGGARAEGTRRFDAREPRVPTRASRRSRRADAACFFGREAEVSALWEKIRRQTLLAVIGPFGRGQDVLPACGRRWRTVPRLGHGVRHAGPESPAHARAGAPPRARGRHGDDRRASAGGPGAQPRRRTEPRPPPRSCAGAE